MPNNVIATGGAPPSINQQLLNQGAAGIGAGLGGRIGQNMATRRAARDLDPLRLALIEAMNQQQPANPQQALIFAAMQDPRMFAQLAGNTPQGAVNIAGMLGAPQQEPRSEARLVDGDSELGRRLGLQPGERARVQFNYDAQGNLIGQPSVVANPLSDDGDGADNPFGASARGRSLEHVANFASGFAEGTLTPEQERIFLTSVSNLTQQEQFTDPDTGLVRTRRPELPRFAQLALQQRGYEIGEAGIIPPVQQPPLPEDVTAQVSAQQTQGENAVASRPPEMPTLYEMAAAGDVNNPISALRRFGTRFGLEAQPEMSALTAATALKERIVKALQQNPRYAEGEAERIGQGFQLDPEVIATNDRYMQRAIAADDTLARIQQEAFEVITGKRAMVPGETRQHAMATFNAITNARQWLIPPRVRNDQEAAEFNRLNPPDTPVLYLDEDGNWKLGYTTGTQQGAQ